MAVERRRLLSANDTKLETDYLTVGKIMHNMLSQNTAPHTVGMVTTSAQVKLLIIVYGAGYDTLLRTKSFDVHSFYKKENMQISKSILASIWRLQVG